MKLLKSIINKPFVFKLEVNAEKDLDIELEIGIVWILLIIAILLN
jgi:hypothetical protein